MMSVVAPIAGASAIVPVVFGIATGDRPSTFQLAGIVLALLGVALASQEHQAGRRAAGRGGGRGSRILAAIGFGFYFPPMHIAGEADPWWASLIFRATATCSCVAAVRPAARRAPPRLALGSSSRVGIGDTLGNLLFAASASYGLVSVTSVLASLYPVVTVALAAPSCTSTSPARSASASCSPSPASP